MKIYEHMERYLGEMARGWKPVQSELGITACLFEDSPYEDLNTYSTLGMSNHVLAIGSKTGRQELLFSAPATGPSEKIASFLTTFAESVVQSGNGLLRGEVVAGKPLFDDTTYTGVYCTNPIFWEDQLSEFLLSSPATVFVWLMPVVEAEAAFIRSKGWNAFESLLEGRELDFWDLNRPSFL